MFRLFQEGAIAQGELSNTLTVKEVSTLLHVHEQTLRHWAKSGMIKAYRVGPRGDRRFSPKDVEAFLQKDVYVKHGGRQNS